MNSVDADAARFDIPYLLALHEYRLSIPGRTPEYPELIRHVISRELCAAIGIEDSWSLDSIRNVECGLQSNTMGYTELTGDDFEHLL